MRENTETQVLIVGGGPVGLVLAMDLADRGIEVLVCERREAGEPPSVKCNHVSARSMEILRGLGVAQDVRANGLPGDYPHDCAYRTTVTGEEITRITIPARDERGKVSGPDTWWPTAEPPHRINQIFLEPILFRHAATRGRVRILNRCEVVSFSQFETGVLAEARDLNSGEAFTIAAEHLVGCDGGRSEVRRAIGAKMVGDPIVQRVQSTYIRAPKLRDLIPGRLAWMNLSLNPRRSGNTIAIDGQETWLIHNYLYEHETDFDSIDRDASIRTILGVGPDFDYEILSNEDWIGRRLVADHFRQGRVFLCGDASHIWVPYAGYGMNAGIADAANLAWLLAAHLNGWAPEAILDAYERERMPITEQVSHFAMGHAIAAMKHRREVPPEVEAAGEVGEKARAAFGRNVYALNVQQYCCGGLNFGYFYDQSPLIAYDGEAHPPYTMFDFNPSSVPGCRTPWFKANGESIYDLMGRDYALLRFDRGVNVEGLLAAAEQRGVPMRLIDIEAPVDAPYKHRLVLSRPDQHVAWRGDQAPKEPEALIDRIRGAA